MKHGDVVVFIDREGQEFNAIVGSVSPFNEDVVNLVYVDPKRGDFASGQFEDSIIRVLDVVHFKHESKDKDNPVHCYSLGAADPYRPIVIPEAAKEADVATLLDQAKDSDK